MNRSFRSVFNARLGAWVAAPEIARGYGKGGVRRAAAAVLATAVSSAWALPSGGEVSAGSGSIDTQGAVMTVSQTSAQLTVNWQSFNVGAAETVRFVQPGSDAVALNRVLGSDPSAIYGKLEANGQVFLLNPNGILFGRGAEVNVGGLVASTLSLSDSDFLARDFRLAGTAGAVVNQGSLTAADGGYLALLGGQVSNQGTLTARLGTVTLAAGSAMTLDFAGDGLLAVQVEQGAVAALAENRALIRADGGTVLLTAKAADALVQAVVNHEGVIEARSVEEREGVIKLLGDMEHGTTQVAGTLDASALGGGDGGFIETSAAHVKIDDSATITTRAETGRNGTWLIDPVDFTIAAAGGDMTGAALSTALASGNVTIQSTAGAAGTAGDVNVNDTVAWSANILTLNARNDININAVMNGSGTAGLALEYGQGAVAADNTSTYNVRAPVNLAASGSFSTKLGSDGSTVNYTIITSLGAAGSTTGTDLQGMIGNKAGRYVLGADIDASPTTGWFVGGSGFRPVGVDYDKFTGVFDGLGHTVSGLYIGSPIGVYVGLFGYTSAAAVIRNVGLLAGNVIGGAYVGSLVGYNLGTISNAYSTTSVGGSIYYVGGLVGVNGGTISNSYAAAGFVDLPSGGSGVGGLVGYNTGTITKSYSSGAVSGTGYDEGGLVGGGPGTVTASFWDTQASGQSISAGGTGKTTAEMQSLDTFTGAGWDIDDAGGTGAVWRIYEGHSYPLLRGFLTPLTITANAADKTYDGLTFSGGNGVTYSTSPGANLLGSVTYGGTSQGALAPGSYTITAGGLWSNQQGYDIAYAGGSLTLNQAPLTVTAYDAAKTYDGLAWSDGNGVAYVGFVNGETSSVLGGTLTYGGASQGAIGAGTYAIAPSGLTSENYALTFVPGTLTVAKAPLTVTANDATKTYDGLAFADGNGVFFTGFVNGETSAVLGGSFTYAGSSQGAINAGVYAITPAGLASNNYALTFVSGTLTVDKAPLTISGSFSAADKTYDGTTAATLTGHTLGFAGLVDGDSVTADWAAAFADPDAGSDKTVTLAGSVFGGADSGNYAIDLSTAPTATADIAQAPLTITGNDAGKTYDGLAWSGGNGVVYAGFVNGETSAALGGALAYVGTSQGAVDAGAYAIAPIGLTSSNYALTFVPGTLTVAQAPLTVTASSAAKTYDGLAWSGGNGVSYSGFVNGETSAVLGGGLVYGGESQGAVDAGTYAITAGGLTSSNYVLSFADGTLTVGKAPLTVTAADASRSYGAASPAFTATLSGFVNGETLATSGVTGSADLGTAATATTAVGTAAITVGAGSLAAGNYDFATFVPGILTITPAPLTVTAYDAAKTYDGLAWSDGNGVAYVGFVNGETSSVLGGTLTYGGASQGAIGAGTYAIAPSGLTSENYALTFVPGTLTVAKAPLTVTASDATKTYDGLAFADGNGVIFTGFVNGETSAALGGSLAYGGTSQGAVVPGVYAIMPFGLVAANYVLTFVPGSLTIRPLFASADPYVAAVASVLTGMPQDPAGSGTGHGLAASTTDGGMAALADGSDESGARWSVADANGDGGSSAAPALATDGEVQVQGDASVLAILGAGIRLPAGL